MIFLNVLVPFLDSVLDPVNVFFVFDKTVDIEDFVLGLYSV